MAKHRLVLIGHGNISHSYLSAFAKVPGVEIAGVVGRTAEKAAAFAAGHGIAVSGTELADVARRSEATAVVVCTPNAAHYENVMEASRLGLHCLCEKPLHISPQRQAEMIASCREHGVKLGVSYMRRFISHMGYIKELIDSGALGRITVVDVTIKHWREPAYYDSWHGTYEHDGGGPFIQQGSHIIDLALWMCGGWREVLEARRFKAYHQIETEDHGYALLQYGNGAVGMIEASTASMGMKKETLEISGTKGSIAANYHEILAWEVPGLAKPAMAGDSPNPVLFERLAADFVRAIEEDRPPFIDGESAKTATELITAIYAKAGEPVVLY
ncbi:MULTISPECIES: Gfo/Idh/MocA family protein [Paenibacillus]|uniref:Gfo/Idh/MocA family protein n=1 Tax=Paenibacillus TaxID=44249 RepID=UPI0022B8F5C9|nr:Gfo/Idh/MocA family oxidoreductase [Paenibacillus caseinilyticus]MCZ8522065.1 Gfo/Idh/MocA family oxidoreductase [Paenibacillus caseinilyticus]